MPIFSLTPYQLINHVLISLLVSLEKIVKLTLCNAFFPVQVQKPFARNFLFLHTEMEEAPCEREAINFYF